MSHHRPVHLLQRWLAIKPHVDAGHEISQSQDHDADKIAVQPQVGNILGVVDQGVIRCGGAKTEKGGEKEKSEYERLQRFRLGIYIFEGCENPDFCHQEYHSGYQMRIYIDGLIVEIQPARKTCFGRPGFRAVAMTDIIVVLVPLRNLVIGEELRDVAAEQAITFTGFPSLACGRVGKVGRNFKCQQWA